MTSAAPNRSGGSRTAAYLVAGALATLPGILLVTTFLGLTVAVGAAVVAWAAGAVWLKKRQEDPRWDRSPTAGGR